MKANKNIGSGLTTIEIASIWTSYVFESMVHHIFSYFINNTEDEEIKAFIEYCQVASRLHIHNYMAFFKKENLPVPRGTTSEDINIHAPKLFSDKFYIIYIKNMAKFALANFAMSYSDCSRPDIRALFKEHMERLVDVDRLAIEIKQSKNIYVTPPFSDRLMLNHAVLLNAYGIGNYALGMSQSQRRDLMAMYGKIMIEVGMYADNGADLLIKRHWLEQPPIISKDKELVKQ